MIVLDMKTKSVMSLVTNNYIGKYFIKSIAVNLFIVIPKVKSK